MAGILGGGRWNRGVPKEQQHCFRFNCVCFRSCVAVRSFDVVWSVVLLLPEREARAIDDGMMYDGVADRHC